MGTRLSGCLRFAGNQLLPPEYNYKGMQAAGKRVGCNLVAGKRTAGIEKHKDWSSMLYRKQMMTENSFL